jgi:transcriptional regulator with XRE-family HTH domain
MQNATGEALKVDCTIVRDFLSEVLGDRIGARCLAAMIHIVNGIIVAGATGYARSARAYVGKVKSVRSLIRRYFRLCDNKNVSVAEICSWAVSFMLKHGARRARMVLAVDWTDIGNYSVLVVSVVLKRRTIPILWTTILWHEDHCEAEERTFLELNRLLPCRPGEERCYVLLADRGFGNTKTIQRATQSGKIQIVIRSRSNVSIRRSDDKGFISLARIKYEIGNKPQDFGFVEFSKTTPCRIRVVRVHRPGQREPWVLVTNLDAPAITICALYALRFLIEETFRDLKDARDGFQLSKHTMKSADRLSRVFALTTLAYILLTIIGLGAETRRWQEKYQSNSRRRELAPFRLGRFVFLDNARTKRVDHKKLTHWSSMLALKIGNWDWMPRPQEVLTNWTTLEKSVKSIHKRFARLERPCDIALRSRLRQLMKDRSIRRAVFAQQLDRSVSQISAVLNGYQSVPRSWIGKITSALGITCEELIGNTGWSPPERSGSRADRTPHSRTRKRSVGPPAPEPAPSTIELEPELGPSHHALEPFCDDSLTATTGDSLATTDEPDCVTASTVDDSFPTTFTPDATEVARRLKALRNGAGVTQRELALKVKVHQGTVSNWEKGKQPIPEAYVPTLTSFFRVPREHLDQGETRTVRRPRHMSCPQCACVLALRQEKTLQRVLLTLIIADNFTQDAA